MFRNEKVQFIERCAVWYSVKHMGMYTNVHIRASRWIYIYVYIYTDIQMQSTIKIYFAVFCQKYACINMCKWKCVHICTYHCACWTSAWSKIKLKYLWLTWLNHDWMWMYTNMLCYVKVYSCVYISLHIMIAPQHFPSLYSNFCDSNMGVPTIWIHVNIWRYLSMFVFIYAVTKTHRMPYLYGSFSAKEPYN